MISLSDIVQDSDLAQPFVILRSSGGAFVAGGWQEGEPQSIDAYGVVTPASEQQLQQVPEGDRVTEAKSFYSVTPMYRTHEWPSDNPGTSDILVWHGQKYRVAAVGQWGDYGFWYAVATRMAGS